MDCSSFSNSSVSDKLRFGAILWRDIFAYLFAACAGDVWLLLTRLKVPRVRERAAKGV